MGGAVHGCLRTWIYGSTSRQQNSMALSNFPPLLVINVSQVFRDTSIFGREEIVRVGNVHLHRYPESHPWQTMKQASRPGAD